MELLKETFNLIDEPWIKVTDMKIRPQKVSIRDLFENAHKYRVINGDCDTQTISIIRVLLAILYSVFARCDTEGEESEFVVPDDSLERWSELWEMGHFPMDVINPYLDKYYDRFYLFDDKYPFMQITPFHEEIMNKVKAKIEKDEKSSDKAKKGWVDINKIDGRIAQSDNKPKMFASEKDEMLYDEAARWLIHLINYDDNSLKRTYKNVKGKPKSDIQKTGWLGRLGLIYAEGKSVFETLMLNLTFLKNGKELWSPINNQDGECAFWELDNPDMTEGKVVDVPTNPAGLYTLMTRHILMIPDEKPGRVKCAYNIIGCAFESTTKDENVFNEQMTLWRKRTVKEEKNKTNVANIYEPKLHNFSIQLWREFHNLFFDKEEKIPGVVLWVRVLKDTNILPNDMIRFRSVAMEYGSSQKSYFINSYSDIINLHAELLKSAGKEWSVTINDEILNINTCAYQIKRLGMDIDKALGRYGTVITKKTTVYPNHEDERFYSVIDPVFRDWLLNIKSTTDKSYKYELEDIVKKTAISLGKDMVFRAGLEAFKGRYVEIEKEKTKRYYASPDSYNLFIHEINKLYSDKDKKKETNE